MKATLHAFSFMTSSDEYDFYNYYEFSNDVRWTHLNANYYTHHADFNFNFTTKITQ